VAEYVPARGDVVWLDFSPQAGHEQAGRRPALVLTAQEYNEKRKLAIVCPITTKVKGFYFEVPIAAGEIQGAVLADQVISLDWTQISMRVSAVAPAGVIEQVLDKIADLLEM
jgi:mRNA interferase MazF